MCTTAKNNKTESNIHNGIIFPCTSENEET